MESAGYREYSLKRSLYFLSLALIAMTASIASGALAQCPSGPKGNLCLAENGDMHAMYRVAREGYLEGRETGDFSEAYKWAWQSKELGFRGGRMVLKMIYLNAGLHNDPVEAHRWLTRAVNGGEIYVVTWRERLEATMTSEQIAEANSQSMD